MHALSPRRVPRCGSALPGASFSALFSLSSSAAALASRSAVSLAIFSLSSLLRSAASYAASCSAFSKISSCFSSIDSRNLAKPMMALMLRPVRAYSGLIMSRMEVVDANVLHELEKVAVELERADGLLVRARETPSSWPQLRDSACISSRVSPHRRTTRSS